MTDKERILKMLEEGKITAEEAAKLLDALSQKKKVNSSTKLADSIMDSVSSIVTSIPEAVSGAFSVSVGEHKEINVKKGDEFVLKSVGSSVKLDTNGKDEFSINPSSGLVKTKKEDSIISSKIIGGSAEILCPAYVNLTIKDAGGMVEGKGTESLNLKQVGGSAKLIFKKIDNVDIDSKGGAVKIYVGDCDFSFDILASHGKIDFNIPADFTENKKDKVKGKVKTGKGKLKIRVYSGSVTVLPIEKSRKEKSEK
jgi:DUF4097 and DUF4098 domain-containing protein YvlB